ncbi:MAG: T9SS type A sorting domain-containing protein [Bacteroidota bacterium]
MNPHFPVWLLLLFLTNNLQAQFIELSSMPEKVSNNAVIAAEVNGKPYVYSFCGIDSTKTWSGIHLKAWRYDVEADQWESLPDVPDPNGGKIAASANLVNGKIYLVGGYHVAANLSETSSDKVHVFDPSTNSWLPDAAPIPVAIDDQVQAVWRDSLIFVVTGWSNTTNVADVQVFNPATNEWSAGTSVPNQNDYKVFGGAGVVIDDTIYYAGGARFGINFPATTVFRKGIINPDNPLEIEWSKETLATARGYRMAAVVHDRKGVWLGGSDVTYNFNGIAYNGSGGVSPLDRITVFDPSINSLFQNFGRMPAVMDLRGAAQVNENEVIIAGGMALGQQVTNQVWSIQLDNLTGVESETQEWEQFLVFPNPADQELTIERKGDFELEMSTNSGSLLFYKTATDKITLPIGNLAPGIYWLDLVSATGLRTTEQVVIH